VGYLNSAWAELSSIQAGGPTRHVAAGVSPSAPNDQEELMRRNGFVKSHALGNDYIVMDPSALSFALTPEAIRLIDFLTEQLATVPGLEDVSLKVVPPTATATIDPDHLGRVLINLLDNAAKYAPGGPVEMRAESHGSTIEIAVVDHGPGIRAEKRGRAFERFGQLENADTRSQGGTGLGLSIVKGLTEAMGGTVELENTPGGGATFVLRLPATPGGRDLRAS